MSEERRGLRIFVEEKGGAELLSPKTSERERGFMRELRLSLFLREREMLADGRSKGEGLVRLGSPAAMRRTKGRTEQARLATLRASDRGEVRERGGLDRSNEEGEGFRLCGYLKEETPPSTLAWPTRRDNTPCCLRSLRLEQEIRGVASCDWDRDKGDPLGRLLIGEEGSRLCSR